MKSDDKWITNIPDRIVGGFSAAQGIGDGWVDWSWQTEDRQGLGIATGGATEAETLTIDLDLSGPHRLFLGLGPYSTLRARLDGMEGHRLIRTEHGGGLESCELWVEDMTDKNLHVCNEPRFYWGHNVAPFLAYVRAVPDARPHQNRRNIVGTEDGGSWMALYGYDGPADMAARYQALRDSDVGRMLVSPGGADFTISPHTEHGTFWDTGTTHAARHIDRQKARGLRTIAKRGDNPMAIAAETMRDLGIEFHFYIRVEAFAGSGRQQHEKRSDFFEAHPEWRCRDEHGDEIWRLSYAYPGVQDHMLAYFEELLRYEPDGLCLAMNRSLPMVLFEEPVLEEFQRRHGRRPDLPRETHTPEMLEVRHDLLEGFIRRLHELYGSGQRALSFIAAGDEDTFRQFGVDAQRLAESGYFRDIYGVNACDPFWQKIQADGRTNVYPDGRVWGPAHDHREIAQYTRDEIFGNGFPGVFFWDIQIEHLNPYDWHVVRRLGTPEFVRDVAEGRVSPPPIDELKYINGVKLGPYNPNRSY
jgi:hypothetical protein